MPDDRERFEHPDPDVRRAVALARGLDDRYIDPIVGLLLPGAGDLITAGAGSYVVWVAIQRRLPAVVVARMLLNLAIDMLLGAIPAVGDIFDFAFKANVHNARLLERSARVTEISALTLAAGNTPPWPGLAPCDSLTSIILTCGSCEGGGKRS